MTLLTVVGQAARIEGKFDIADSLQIECEIGGELAVGGQRAVGEKGIVRNGNVTRQTAEGKPKDPADRLEEEYAVVANG